MSSYYFNFQLLSYINFLYFLKKRLQKLDFKCILWNLEPTLYPLNFQKMPLKEIILAYHESNPSRIALNKLCCLWFYLFLKLLSLKNAITFYILKKKKKRKKKKKKKRKTDCSSFPAAFYFLIDFSKILQFIFPYSQSKVLNILRK